MTIVGQRSMPRQRDGILRRTDAPGMLSVSSHDPGRRFGRPADRCRIAQRASQLFKISGIGIGLVASRRKPSRGQRSILLGVELFVQPPAHHGPIAQIFRDRPKQPQTPLAQPLDIGARGVEKFLSLRPDFFRKNRQKLFAAARSKQHLRKPKLRDERARQHLAQQAHPAQSAGKSGSSGAPANRNSSVPEILPCSRICTDMQNRRRKLNVARCRKPNRDRKGVTMGLLAHQTLVGQAILPAAAF